MTERALETVRELFTYNTWANRRIFEALAQFPPEEYLRDLRSSHGGIHGTLAHIVGAEKIWLSRWTGGPVPAVLQGKDVASLAELRAIWEDVETERTAFLSGLSDRRLEETLAIKTTKGEEFVHTYGEMFRHVVDHSSYHRGQIVTMLRQLGVKPPSTGLIMFYRERPKRS